MKTQNSTKQNDLASFISNGTPDVIRRRYAALPILAESIDFGDLNCDTVVLDTEATGFSFHHDELTQIAAARIDKGKIVEWFVTFVNPGKPIPADVAHLTHIYDEDVSDAPDPAQALSQLVAFVGDAKIVAHNIEFDRTFTTRHPDGYPLLENVWIDSLDLARIALPRLKSHRLLDLVRAFGAPLSTHRADADVAATCAIYRILLAGVAAMPAPLVRKISYLVSRDEWSTGLVFEKIAEMQLCEGFQEHIQKILNPTLTVAPRPAFGSKTSLPAQEDVSRETIPPVADGDFSLRSIRHGRLRNLEQKEKQDADDIAATPGQDFRFPSEEELDAAFSPEGLVGALYTAFEFRPQQARMAKAISTAFASSGNLVVEAGTGVGKSMAYLIPAAFTACENDIVVGVATKTNALLDQLVYHELPALKKALARAYPDRRPLTYAPLKGFSHYPCLRKVEQLIDAGVYRKPVAGKERTQAPACAALLSFIEQTSYDDMDGLKIDYRVLPRQAITTTSRDCLRRKCPYYKTTCFVHGARRYAQTADIVITNHSLLFCDLIADGGLLPPVRYWVVDEAHGTEAEARRAFSISVNAEDMVYLSRRVGADAGAKNIFVRAERHIDDACSDTSNTLLHALLQKARVAGGAYANSALEFAGRIKSLLVFDENKRNKNYETVEVWINKDVRNSAIFGEMLVLGQTVAQDAKALVVVCQELVGLLEGIDGAAGIQREIASAAMELQDQVRAVNLILSEAPDSYAYSAVLNRKKDKLVEQLKALPINVGEEMNATLFPRTHSVVFTSATLAIKDSFSAFEEALGLNTSEYSVCQAYKLNSAYNFDEHMTIYVAQDMPEPNEAAYLKKLQELLVVLHRAQKGSMLTLFTNRKDMEKCFEKVQPQLKEDDLRVICQKWGVSIKGLRDEFLEDEHLSLFALKSFWEGFDAPGATLRGVIIPKLPFAKPTDPLSCERAMRDEQAWRHYVLPAAVLEVRQAAGRLIRNAQDSGVLILADKRLLTKSYGKTFLGSLPSHTIKVMAIAEIANDLSIANNVCPQAEQDA